MRPQGTVLHKVWLGAGIASLMTLAGCGYGGSIRLPNTSGNYSAATLSGTYVYEVHGDSINGLYREVGAFTADGAGHITAGSDDSNLNNGGSAVSFTGSYQVFKDGTGSISFNNSALGPINFAITVVSSSKVDLIEGDGFADGAGVAEFQPPSAIAATPNGTFVFRLHESASAQSSGLSESDVGAVSISGNTIASGTGLDRNLGGTSSQLTVTGGSFGTPSGMGRGTATLTDNTPFSTTLIYYIVDNAKLVLLVTNATAIGSGEAELQTGAVANGLSGKYAFGSRGDDTFVNGFFNGTATVGSFTASGNAINPYTFDSMQDGSYSNGTISGTSTTSANGRVAVTLNSGAAPEVFWMVNPARAFFLINSASEVEDGTADLQTVNSFSGSTMNGQYAMVMDGIEFPQFPQLAVVLDLARIGPMHFDGSAKLTLSELVNLTGNGAQPPAGGGLNGTYQVGSSAGRITGTLSNSAGGLDLVMYAISGSDAYVLQGDAGLVTSGTISLQH